MKCPHLVNMFVCTCAAEETPYVPSLFELEEYCRNTRHSRCPFYLGTALSSGSGSQQWAISAGPCRGGKIR